MAAVLCDLNSGRIPNSLIVTGLACGLAYQLAANGMLGIILFLGGICLPFLLLGALYYFRMMGAGDIKLLCMAGGYMGPLAVLSCLIRAILFGAVISAMLVCRRRNLRKRMVYFTDYIEDYSKSGQWRSYLTGSSEDARFCFSIPILLGILFCMFLQ